MQWTHTLLAALLLSILVNAWPADVVDTTTIKGKIYCGYQGWFRCPGDGVNVGWIHWSRRTDAIAPDLVTFDLWPDMTEYSPKEHYIAPGFTYPDGSQATLFSSATPETVLKHFEWMRDYGIDGVFLQHFAVDLPGGRLEERYPSRLRVLNNVRRAAKATGRVWALSYDIASVPTEDIYKIVTDDWKRMVDKQLTKDPRYLHEGGKPVVQIWGYYYQNQSNHMTTEVGQALIDFFKAPGKYQAWFVAGGDWNWRSIQDEAWQATLGSADAYCPWNIGNWAPHEGGGKQASIGWWPQDKAQCEAKGVFWMPVVYPGFTWDNIFRYAPGTSKIDRRGGEFLWEQFYGLAQLGVDTVYVAMFDEVDEGTAIFKVTSSPPTQGYFVGYDGLPSDWYLRLVGEGGRMLRGERPLSKEIPIQP